MRDRLKTAKRLVIAIPISYVIDLHSNGEHAKQSVENFYSMHHPYIEFDEYYAGIRTISIMPENYDSADSWEEAKSFAETIYNEWLSGEATEDSFADICDKYGADQGGGQLYMAEPGWFVKEVDEWCFDRTRQTGDVAIIESIYGYTLCYFSTVIER